MNRSRTGVGPWLSSCMALFLLATPRSARANDVSNELTAGAISSRAAGSSPYVSDRVGGSVDATERLALSLDTTFTRYFKSNHVPGENILQIAAATDYAPSDHFAFGLDLRGSPPSTTVTRIPTDTVKSRTSLLGAGVSAEYDTASDDPLDTILNASLAISSYSTTQRARRAGTTTPSSLAQYRIGAGVTEVFWENTEGELSGSWYAYSTDPTGTGYFGTSVFGRDSVSDGLPLEPLRWSLRPTVRQRLGRLRLTGFFQYGRYVGDTGSSVIAGLKAQVKASQDVRIWAAVDFQRDVQASGEIISIPWGSLGIRVYL